MTNMRRHSSNKFSRASVGNMMVLTYFNWPGFVNAERAH